MKETLEQAILRVEMMNDRSNWVAIHNPTTGRYTAINPKKCRKCGKLLHGVPIDEPCTAPSKGWED